MDAWGEGLSEAWRAALQLATLVYLRTQAAGHREALAKQEQARVKHELILASSARNKAHDGRNHVLAVELERNRAAIAARGPGVSLDRPRQPAPARNSVDYRQGVARAMERHGIAPELAAVRLLMEVGQAQSAAEAMSSTETPAQRRERELELERTRARQRAQSNGHARVRS